LFVDQRPRPEGRRLVLDRREALAKRIMEPVAQKSLSGKLEFATGSGTFSRLSGTKDRRQLKFGRGSEL
jgi:hypothetical protein